MGFEALERISAEKECALKRVLASDGRLVWLEMKRSWARGLVQTFGCDKRLRERYAAMANRLDYRMLPQEQRAKSLGIRYELRVLREATRNSVVVVSAPRKARRL